MFALIRQYEGLDAKTRETATRKANDELRPLLTNSRGFVSYELLQPDGNESAVTSISVFESRAHAEASQTIARDGLGKNLPSTTPPCTAVGDVEPTMPGAGCGEGLRAVVGERGASAVDSQWLAAIVESSDDAILSKALDGTIRSWNPAAERLYGYRAEEVVGRSVSIIIPPDRPGEMTRILERLAAGERIEHYETVRVAKSGRLVDVSLSIAPVRDSRGSIDGAATIARDIGRHKAVERYVQAQLSVTSVLTRNTSLERAAPRLLAALASWLGWEGGRYWAIDDAVGTRRLVSQWWRGGHRTRLDTSTTRRSREQLAAVWQRQRARTWERHSRPDTAAVAVAFPVVVDGAVRAIVEGESRRADTNPALRESLEAIGHQIGGFLDRLNKVARLDDSEREKRLLLGRMVHSEQEQRQRIATELHDDAIQVMTASLLRLDQLERRFASGDLDGALDALRAARSALEQATDRARRLTFELRPQVLEAHGLGAAISGLLEQTAANGDLATTCDVHVGRYDSAVEELVFRTVAEALANASKHADACQISVRLSERDGQLVGAVSDDGAGFDVDTAVERSRATGHMGLDTMAERVRLGGGNITIESRPSAGTSVEFFIPTTPLSG